MLMQEKIHTPWSGWKGFRKKQATQGGNLKMQRAFSETRIFIGKSQTTFGSGRWRSSGLNPNPQYYIQRSFQSMSKKVYNKWDGIWLVQHTLIHWNMVDLVQSHNLLKYIFVNFYFNCSESIQVNFIFTCICYCTLSPLTD